MMNLVTTKKMQMVIQIQNRFAPGCPKTKLYMYSNPSPPTEVNGGYSWGLKDFGPFGRNYFPQCCHAAHALDET